MSEFKERSANRNIKIARDENGQIIKTPEGILYEYTDNEGNTTLKFAKTSSSSCNESSTESENIMPCSTASLNSKEKFVVIKEEKESHGILWTNDESKELLKLYYENIGQIGPFSTFKNKKCTWEFISNEISKKYEIIRSPLQCEYRYKNMLKRRNIAKKNNKTSGNEKCDVDFEEEFELINSIDDSIEPDICFGIGQYTVKKRKVDTLSEEEVENKVQKSPSILTVLRDIQNEKEKQKERRHQEKIEVLRELFATYNKS